MESGNRGRVQPHFFNATAQLTGGASAPGQELDCRYGIVFCLPQKGSLHTGGDAAGEGGTAVAKKRHGCCCGKFVFRMQEGLQRV